MSSRILKVAAAAVLALPIVVVGVGSASAEQIDPCGAITDEARCEEGGMDLKLNEGSGDLYQVSSSGQEAQGPFQIAVALCDVGDEIVNGGGAFVLSGGNVDGQISAPLNNVGPNSNRDGWVFGIDPSGANTVQVSAFAICRDTDAPAHL